MKYSLPTNIKIALPRLQCIRGARKGHAVSEQPEVPVPVLTKPRAKRKFKLVPSRDAEIYPLMFCVSVGSTLGAVCCLRQLLFSPDVNVSRHRRETPAWERYKREDGQQYWHTHHQLANLRPNPVNTSPDANKLHQAV
ncbi:hypothetical protein PHYBOEH_009271 [Phytophthora boehmeriae]|uniref:Uncharacterized protein n=1 Tax=Phytophthora boehmeriae TaxID=109152 RepID=A0A8T1VU20_9STRA|nr:hypothetical protein PHYBOEH_009271 [Phytophthora boehmeriae]